MSFVDNLSTKPHQNRDITGFVLLGFYLLSLAFPGFYTNGHNPAWGINILLAGFMGVLQGNFAWFANIGFAVGLFSYFKKRFSNAAIWSVFAAVLQFQALGTKEWWHSEAHGSPVTNMGPGYVLWAGSILCLMILSFHQNYKEKKKR